MTFFLRKSFSVGPVRLNLSRSGVTPSIGVRGARVGVRAGGDPYVHAGRHGVYYRRTLGGGAAPSARSPERRAVVAETGVTYSAPAEWRASRGPSRRVVPETGGSVRWLVAGALVALALATVAVRADGAIRWTGLVAAAVAVGVWTVHARRHWLRRRAASTLRGLLDSLAAAGPLPEATERSIRHAVADPHLHPADRLVITADGYRRLAVEVVRDGRVTSDERALLDALERHLELAPGACVDARIAAFHHVFLEAVADHELTQDEEATLEHVRSALDIPDDALAGELGVLERLRTMRAMRAGELTPVVATVPLQKTETCYYEAPGRLLRERNLRSFQRDGVRYNVRGLVVDSEGTLVITDKRLLVVHSGTSVFPLNRILDIEVDADENVLRITRDGVAAPTIITTPDAVMAGATLASVAGF